MRALSPYVGWPSNACPVLVHSDSVVAPFSKSKSLQLPIVYGVKHFSQLPLPAFLVSYVVYAIGWEYWHFQDLQRWLKFR